MISVVMPAYNAAKYLEPAVQSILDQDFAEPYELIVVDDGSTDSTPEILARFAEQYPDKMRALRKENGGISRAMNMGIEQARYKWIAIMHSDDVALPNRLTRQLAEARKHPEVVAWGTWAYHVNETGEILGMSRFGPESVDEFQQLWQVGKDVIVLHPTAFLKREIVEKVGGYSPDFTNSEELDLFSRMGHHGPVVAVPEPLLYYRLHGSSNTMRRFHIQRRNTRFVRARRAAEIAGEPPLTMEQFIQQREQRPTLTRWRESIIDTSHFYYRKAAMLYGQKKYIGCAWALICCGALNPKYPIRKVWLQVFSPSARRLMKATKANANPMQTKEQTRPA